MPNEDGDQNRNENDNHDAERRCAAAVSTVLVHYNRAISHTGSYSFRRCSAPLIPTTGKHHQAGGRKAAAMWAGIGLALSCMLGFCALLKSRRAGGSYYAAEVYGLTARSHRVYAVVSAIFAAFFSVALFVRALPSVPLLGAYALVFIFYFSSFARGFSDEE